MQDRRTYMSKFAIIGDSTCDLTPELRKEHDIDYARMRVSWTSKDKKEHEVWASLDWQEGITHKEYFDMLAGGTRIFTSQVSEQEYDEVFGRHLEAGEDVLYISCSSALSASVQLAIRLVSKYEKQYPGRKVVIVDPLNSCMGQGMMLLKADEMRKAGKSIIETAAWLENYKLCYNQIATVENLTTLKNAGRVKASKAFFGNLFGVKPMLISDAKGNNYAIEKQKGRRNALLRIVEMAKELAIDPETSTCWISEAECKPEDIELLVSNLKTAVKFKEVNVVPMGPIIGGTTGKGTIGVFFFGKKVEVVGE